MNEQVVMTQFGYEFAVLGARREVTWDRITQELTVSGLDVAEATTLVQRLRDLEALGTAASYRKKDPNAHSSPTPVPPAVDSDEEAEEATAQITAVIDKASILLEKAGATASKPLGAPADSSDPDGTLKEVIAESTPIAVDPATLETLKSLHKDMTKAMAAEEAEAAPSKAVSGSAEKGAVGTVGMNPADVLSLYKKKASTKASTGSADADRTAAEEQRIKKGVEKQVAEETIRADIMDPPVQKKPRAAPKPQTKPKKPPTRVTDAVPSKAPSPVPEKSAPALSLPPDIAALPGPEISRWLIQTHFEESAMITAEELTSLVKRIEPVPTPFKRCKDIMARVKSHLVALNRLK